jgi:hypothetical protein
MWLTKRQEERRVKDHKKGGSKDFSEKKVIITSKGQEIVE